MRNLYRALLIAGLLMILSACSHHSLDDYSQSHPSFIAEEFFKGDLIAKGVLKDRSGKVTRHFSASIHAKWQQGIGTLEEKFIFDDGEIQYRNWTLTPQGKGYSATAGDVIGTGWAQTNGNAMRLDYTLSILYNNKPLQLQVEDWMWLIDDKTLLNQSTLRKWGFTVGSIQLVISKP